MEEIKEFLIGLFWFLVGFFEVCLVISFILAFALLVFLMGGVF